jgi:predicted MFS family arabinose efflux permease
MIERSGGAAQLTSGQAASPDVVAVLLVGLIAFLTVVDLFGTLGMAIAGVVVALFGGGIDCRRGILTSLVILAIPTALLAVAPGLWSFAGLRVMQGLLMATAFSLTLTYLGEELSPAQSITAVAAYITGNVASNLFGRLISAGAADHFGLAGNFLTFSALNLLGAGLVLLALHPSMGARERGAGFSAAIAGALAHLRNPALLAAFGIGFCILFAFIGTFTFVNFVLPRPPFGLGMMDIGLVYFVFLPAILTTPFAGRVARSFGARPTLWASLGLAGIGLAMLLSSGLGVLLTGLVLVGVGTFFAQATAVGFVGRVAQTNRSAASGIYLACYFLGGLIGTAVLGQLFSILGWPACLGGISVALLAAAVLTARLDQPP